MIAVDTNLLVHAHQREASLHGKAKGVLRDLAQAHTPWGICFHCLVEFYGVVTQPRLWREPSTPEQAMDQINAWTESPSLRIIGDQPGMLAILGELVISNQVKGSMVHDARIVCCCEAHGVTELWTVDRDFSRFLRLRTRNPLA